MVRLTAAVWVALTAIAVAHPGGLDDQGGHHDRKTGKYHIHRPRPSPAAPMSSPPAGATSSLAPTPSPIAAKGTAAPAKSPTKPAPEPDWHTWFSADRAHRTRAVAMASTPAEATLWREGETVVRVPLAKLAQESAAYFRWCHLHETFPNGLYGRVVRVVDGDTVFVKQADGTELSIRLEGIDAPESNQAGGAAATAWLTKRAGGKWVKIAWRERDRYGRIVGHVHAGVEWINCDAVLAGHAWHFVKYSQDAMLAAAEAAARHNRVGLWSEPDPVAPWDHRAARKTAAALKKAALEAAPAGE
ncbi:MAG: thermonuclease family protein [Pirellulales bacterium]|nr:thermonuclease family protein [Pirellulales bacterium]